MSNEERPKGIYQAMVDILNDIKPLAKTGKNLKENYNYTKVDDIFHMVQPLMAKHGVFLTHEIIGDDPFERTKEGRDGSYSLYYKRITVRVVFYHSDGSSVSAVTKAEAMDNGDKGYNKAIMAAVKYVLIPTFQINTGEGIDTENEPPAQTSFKAKPPSDKKPLPSPKERVEANRQPKLTDKAWLYQKMIEYKISPDYHNQIYIWAFDDAKSGGQEIIAWGGSLGEEKFKAVVCKFADKADAEAK